MLAARLRGFTLIELMVALAILAFLLVLAAPQYVVWVADNQVRAASDLFAGGLRYAQGEAVKRNEQVQLVVDPTTATGGWQAILVSDGSVLQVGVLAEGADKIQVIPAPVGTTTITFTGMGFPAPTNPDASAPFEILNLTRPGVAGARALRILVGGGRTGIKICDPAWPASDPKGCPPVGG